MKVHIAKKSGSRYYKNLPECGTRPRRNSHANVCLTMEFKYWAHDPEMVCEKCLKAAKEQGRI
jgi:hypothetical protein